MVETVLIDGDLLCYRSAAVTEQQDENIARWQVSEMVRRILHETNSMSYRVFLSGSNNFRYSVYPDYKANRRDMPRPKWLQQVREELVTAWNASVTDGIEADDAMSIAQCSEYEDSVICSIDKDMLQVSGKHYNFVKQEFRHISPLEGLRNFYWQLVMGDRADNIFGYDGKARQTIPKFLLPLKEELEAMTDEWDMFALIKDLYNDDDRLLMNGCCLWLCRKDENERWEFPTKK